METIPFTCTHKKKDLNEAVMEFPTAFLRDPTMLCRGPHAKSLDRTKTDRITRDEDQNEILKKIRAV